VPEIGNINERSLHAALKALYCRDGCASEVTIEHYIVDVVDSDGRIIEIQTSTLSRIRKKISALLANHRVKLVYPIVVEKTLYVYESPGGNLLYSRKSPKKGGTADVFREVLHIRDILLHPNFELEIVFVNAEELRAKDGKGSWRRGGTSIVDKRLTGVVKRLVLKTADDYRRVLPPSLPTPFTNADLSTAKGITVDQARRITYCLKNIGLLEQTGKKGRFHLYLRN
jgi:hypothetical protein